MAGCLTQVFNFCVFGQELISLSSLLASYKKREWQKNLSFECIMCFTEPVPGGTHSLGRDLPQSKGVGDSGLPLPCLLLWRLADGDSERQSWEGGRSFALLLVSGQHSLLSLAVGPVSPIFMDCLGQFIL